MLQQKTQGCKPKPEYQRDNLRRSPVPGLPKSNLYGILKSCGNRDSYPVIFPVAHGKLPAAALCMVALVI